MYLNKERLERWQHVATIISLLAVPVVLAVGGWWIQRQSAQADIEKEYVQLAVAIIQRPPVANDKQSQQLRYWATQIVEEFAPMKLSQAPLSFSPKPKFEEKLVLPRDTHGPGWWFYYDGSPESCKKYHFNTKDKEGLADCMEQYEWDAQPKGAPPKPPTDLRVLDVPAEPQQSPSRSQFRLAITNQVGFSVKGAAHGLSYRSFYEVRYLANFPLSFENPFSDKDKRKRD